MNNDINNKSFLKPRDYWDTLSLREKAAMINIAVKNDIYNIQDIKDSYNELAANDVNIYSGIDESTNQMQVQNKSFVDNTIPIIYNTEADKPIYINSTTGDVWQSGKPIGSFVLPEVTITATNPKNEKHRVEDFIQNIIPTGKEIAGQNIGDYLTESNDNAWVDIPFTYRKKNPHLEERGVKGAKSHVGWAKEHPVADVIGNVAASVPFAVASYPLWGSAITGLSSYAPTMANTLAPGSSLWMNPLTKQMAASTLGGSTMDVMSTLVSGKTIGENVVGLTEQTTGWNPYSSIWTSWIPDMANLGYIFPTNRPLAHLLPTPFIPSRMNMGRNFGPLEPDKWNNWGSESLVQLTDKHAVKIPKEITSPYVTEPKVFDKLGRQYKYFVNNKLTANKIPGFEPYEYIGYHTTDKGYIPVFRQNKLTIMGNRNPEGLRFNKEALSDIHKAMKENPGLWNRWDIGDYTLGHNIGKNAEGVGKLYDALYNIDAWTKTVNYLNIPKWEVDPINTTRLLNSIIKYNEEK